MTVTTDHTLARDVHVADAARSAQARLKALLIGAGVAWGVAFVVVGMLFHLQLYADGSMFAYGVAADDSWAFHWHNIPGRLIVYLVAHVPAETYVALTHDGAGGIALYGILFFAAPLAGLFLTWWADRSPGQVFLTAAGASTALVCPLVFGFPTEMWFAHALFWPALALAHASFRGRAHFALLVATLLALSLTHGGGVLLAVAVVATLSLAGPSPRPLVRGGGALAIALIIWFGTKSAFPPDAYFGAILPRAAMNFIDISVLFGDTMRLLVVAMAATVLLFLILRRHGEAVAIAGAVLTVTLGLAVYWIWRDHDVLASGRYGLRTVLMIVTPIVGGIAAVIASRYEIPPLRIVRPIADIVLQAAERVPPGALISPVLVVMLVHVGETSRFVHAWDDYRQALRGLAMGTAADPGLGSRKFVSAHRLGPKLNRMAWQSTTEYLSVLVAPDFRPRKLVVDADAGYYWLPCHRALRNAKGQRGIPRESRLLIASHECLHRPD